MAQTTKTKSSKSSNGSSSRSGTRRKASGSSRSTSAKRSSSSRSSNGSRAKGASASRSKPRAQSRSTQSSNGAGSFADTAIDKAKTSGHAVADAASKAKTPLIAGGTALAGAAVGAVVKSRLGGGKKGPLKRLGASNPMAKLDVGKFDLDAVKSFASQVKSYSQQASDIADAVEKTRKKN